jgi:hypothetical protein
MASFVERQEHQLEVIPPYSIILYANNHEGMKRLADS